MACAYAYVRQGEDDTGVVYRSPGNLDRHSHRGLDWLPTTGQGGSTLSQAIHDWPVSPNFRRRLPLHDEIPTLPRGLLPYCSSASGPHPPTDRRSCRRALFSIVIKCPARSLLCGHLFSKSWEYLNRPLAGHRFSTAPKPEHGCSLGYVFLSPQQSHTLYSPLPSPYSAYTRPQQWVTLSQPVPGSPTMMALPSSRIEMNAIAFGSDSSFL